MGQFLSDFPLGPMSALATGDEISTILDFDLEMEKNN